MCKALSFLEPRAQHVVFITDKNSRCYQKQRQVITLGLLLLVAKNDMKIGIARKFCIFFSLYTLSSIRRDS